MAINLLYRQRANLKHRFAASLTFWALSTAAMAAAPSQEISSPEAFIQSVYANYQNLAPETDTPNFFGAALRKRYFSERFVKALERDERCTPEGDIGALSSDVFIAAQDFGQNGIGPISIKALGRARFAVSFELFPESPPAERSISKISLQLVLQNSQWRIANLDQALEALESSQCESAPN